MARLIPIWLPLLYASAQQTYCQTQYGHCRSRVKCKNAPIGRNLGVRYGWHGLPNPGGGGASPAA